MKPPMTTLEARAHLLLVELAMLAHHSFISDREALVNMERHLRVFRERCNCGRILSFSPWVDGMRAVVCPCGYRSREVPLADY